jgi:hypothetical protein
VAPKSIAFLSRNRFPLRCFMLLLVGFGLPRASLPSGLTLACAFIAWSFFALALLFPKRPTHLLLQLVSAAALLALAAREPTVWVAVGLGLIAVRLGVLIRWSQSSLVLAMGLGCPAAFYAALFAVGEDQRVALGLAFHLPASWFELAGTTLALVLLAALTAALVREARAELPSLDSKQPSFSVAWSSFVGLLVFMVLAVRAGFILSAATLRTDLLVWSEPPALVNLLKLHAGEPFYGPMERADSYSYSPGLELAQYVLLRPFRLELALRAHRVLGLLWQTTSAVVLARALWPWLGMGLRRSLGKLAPLAFPLLLVGLLSVTLSSLLAAYVHPDHLLLLCFCASISLCLRADPFSRRDWIGLGVLPIAATAFKLTGAGIGLGFVLASLFERRLRALGVLVVSGILALLTIPLFDATLGSFSAYALRLQASHSIEWWRMRSILHTVPGLIFQLAAFACLVTSWVKPNHPTVRASCRVLLLTVGVGVTSLVAFLKHGGRENSLMPFALGGVAAILVLLGNSPAEATASRERSSAAPSELPILVLFWAALSSAWTAAPIIGETRLRLVATHDREVAFLNELFGQGKHPWSQGTAAWIDAGRRTVPIDRLSSVSELELGHLPEVSACEGRLVSGEYDGLFLSASALADNDFLLRLRPRLARTYRMVEPSAEPAGEWAASRDGYVILRRRSASPDSAHAVLYDAQK